MKQTKLVEITDIEKQKAILEEAGQIIRDGGLVVFPTETVYGIGANGLDADACRSIYVAKGRPSDNPLILTVPDEEGPPGSGCHPADGTEAHGPLLAGTADHRPAAQAHRA